MVHCVVTETFWYQYLKDQDMLCLDLYDIRSTFWLYGRIHHPSQGSSVNRCIIVEQEMSHDPYNQHDAARTENPAGQTRPGQIHSRADIVQIFSTYRGKLPFSQVLITYLHSFDR